MRTMHRSTPRSPRTAALVVASLLLSACAGERATGPRAGGAPPSASISDAVHENGVPGFYFLPPMVANPATRGTADDALAPVVEVCEWSGACGRTVARFAGAEGTGGERVVRVNGSHYQANWRTDVCDWGACRLDPAKTYRIVVRVGPYELGHADVDVVASGSELRNVNTNEYIPLLDGRTLPIKFRAEQGIVGRVTVEPPGPYAFEYGDTLRLRPIFWNLHEEPIPGAASNWSLAFGGSTGSGAGGTGPSLGGDGLFSAGATAGSGSITVSGGGRSTTVPFVVLVPVAEVRFQAPVQALPQGGTGSVAAAAHDAAGNALPGRAVAYASGSPSVATVDAATGAVTAVSPGVATITASAGGRTGSSLFLVYGPSGGSGLGISFGGSTGSAGATLQVNNTLELVATFNVIGVPPSNLTGFVEWRTGNAAIATVSSAGLVTAVGPGSTTISACVGTYCATLPLTVPAAVAVLDAPGVRGSAALDVNARGAYVGYLVKDDPSDGAEHAFLWTPEGGLQLLDPADATGCRATGINAHDQVALYCETTPIGRRGYRWDAGAFTDLGDLALALSLGSRSAPVTGRLNDAGVVTGSATTFQDIRSVFSTYPYPIWSSIEHAFRWEDGVMTDLGSAGARNQGDRWSRGVDVTASGTIAGTGPSYQGFWNGTHYDAASVVTWSPTAGFTNRGLMTGGYPSAGLAYAAGINAAGVIVGYGEYDARGRASAFASFPGQGDFAKLGLLDGGQTYATDVDDQNRVAGYGDPATGRVPFVWTPQTGDVKRLDLPAGGTGQANAISPAAGRVAGSISVGGRTRAAVWTLP